MDQCVAPALFQIPPDIIYRISLKVHDILEWKTNARGSRSLSKTDCQVITFQQHKFEKRQGAVNASIVLEQCSDTL